MIIPIELRFEADKDSKSAFRTDKTIKSHDVKSVEFHITIDGLELTDNHTAKILSMFHSSKSQANVDCEIVEGKIIYKPDTNLITRYEHVTNYVYVYNDNQSVDVREFIYVVDLSKIDETSLEVKEVYDQSYADLLADFEQALSDYKDNLPQADSVRADIDEILNQFSEDSQKAIGDLNEVTTTVEVAEASRINAEQARKEAETLREESYEQKVDAAIVEADVVEKVDNKVTELTPQINSLTAQLAQKVTHTELDAQLATLLDGGPSIMMDSLSQLQSTYPNGASGVALVRGTEIARLYIWNGDEWQDFGPYQGIEIKNGTVTYEKTNFFEVVSKNLVDMSKVLNGHTIAGATGLPYPSGSVNLLGPYPIKSSTTYTFKSVANYGYYRADGSFISTSAANVDAPVTITTPADAAEIKLVYYPAKPLVQMNEGSTLLPYEEFKLGFSKKIDQLTETEKSDIKMIPIIKSKQDSAFGSDVTITADTSDLLKTNMSVVKNNESYNYQRDLVQYGWFYKKNATKMRFKERASNYGSIVLTANSANAIFLDYKGANAGRVMKAGINTVSQVMPKFADVAPYTTAEGDELLITFAAYVVTIKVKKVGESEFTPYLTLDLSSKKTDIDSVGQSSLGILTLTSGSIDLLEYGFSGTIEHKVDTLYKEHILGDTAPLTPEQIRNVNKIPNLESRIVNIEGAGGGNGGGYFADDIWTAMGDSITAWDHTVSEVFGINYREHVKNQLAIGMANNRGIGSTMIARKDGYEFDHLSFIERWSNNTPRNTTILTVWGGTNDYAGAGGDGVPLGSSELSNRDKFTFYGALRVLIEELSTTFPSQKIGFMTPIFRVNCHQPNLQGHKLIDYVDAIIEVCAEYGIPVLDLFRISGINEKNHVTLLADGLHPKGVGQLFISRKIAKFIDRL